MASWEKAARDAVIPGALAGAATAVTAAVCGRREGGSAVAPINAVSHFLWGDKAAAVDTPTVKHTAVGYATNTAATIFWSTLHEKLFGDAIDRHGLPAAMISGVAVSGLAYVTDYYLVPKRLTPGYELSLSNRSLFAIYSALAASLGAGSLLARRVASQSRAV